MKRELQGNGTCRYFTVILIKNDRIGLVVDVGLHSRYLRSCTSIQVAYVGHGSM